MIRTAMTARILNGNELAADLRSEAAWDTAELFADTGVRPGLAAVLVGDDPASSVYVRNKRRACDEAGLFSETFRLPSDTTQRELTALINSLNANRAFHGILVQLPLPGHLNETEAIERIDPRKDVDGLHPVSQGRMLQGYPTFLPCTPAGVQQVLLRSGYDPAGQHVVIVGRSNIVGKPLAAPPDAAQRWRQRHGHRLPHQDPRPARHHPPGRHSRRRHGRAARHRSRNGAPRSRGHRRGNQPR